MNSLSKGKNDQIVYTLCLKKVLFLLFFLTSEIVLMSQTLDESFKITIKGPPGATDFQIQEDGKIIYCGLITLAGQERVFGVVRLDESGTVDDSFKTVPLGHKRIWEIAYHPSSGVIVAVGDTVHMFNKDGSDNISF